MKVVKFLLIFLLIFILLLGVGTFFFLRNFDLNRLKPQLCSEVSRAIGRTVTIERVRLDLSAAKGVVLQIEGLRIKDDPQFSDAYFADVRMVECEVDVLTFLRERTIVFTNLNIKSPLINVVRNEKGIFNIPGTSPASIQNGISISPDAANKTGESGSVGSKPPSGITSLPALRADSIRITDGKVRYVDSIFTAANPLVVDKISLGVDNLALTQRFPMTFDCAFLSPRQNIHIKAKIQFDFLRMQVRLTEVDLRSDLANIALPEISKLFPPMANVGIERVQGKISLAGPSLIFSDKGVERLSLKADLSQGLVVLKSLPKPVSDINAQIELNEQKLDIKALSALLASGKMTGAGTVMDYLKAPRYNFEFGLQNIFVEEMASFKGTEVAAEGRANAQIKGQGEVKPGEDPLKTLMVNGAIKADGLKLKNVNILKTILGRITIIPGLYEMVYQNIDEGDRQKLARDYVIFQIAEADITAQNGIFSLPRIDLISDVAIFKGKADLDSRFNLDFSGFIMIPKDFSSRIVKSVEQFAGLQDADGLVNIPLSHYKGNLNSFKTMPDLEVIGRKFMITEGKKQIENLLDKALGTGEKQSQVVDNSVSPNDSSAPESEKNSTRQAIEGILNAVFDKLPSSQ